jgi:hypothetical protein
MSDKPNKPRQGEVTNPVLIRELTESVEEYIASSKETLMGEKGMLRLRKELAETVPNLPDIGNDVANWDQEKADRLAEVLDRVALCHEGQKERFEEQAVALRRMNKAVVDIREEALNEKG